MFDIDLERYVYARIHQAIINGESIKDLCEIFASKEVPLDAIELWGFPWMYECYDEYCKTNKYDFGLHKNESLWNLWEHKVTLTRSEFDELLKTESKEVKIEDRDNY